LPPSRQASMTGRDRSRRPRRRFRRYRRPGVGWRRRTGAPRGKPRPRRQPAYTGASRSGAIRSSSRAVTDDRGHAGGSAGGRVQPTIPARATACALTRSSPGPTGSLIVRARSPGLSRARARAARGQAWARCPGCTTRCGIHRGWRSGAAACSPQSVHVDRPCLYCGLRAGCAIVRGVR
jgi:hypothetical protein